MGRCRGSVLTSRNPVLHLHATIWSADEKARESDVRYSVFDTCSLIAALFRDPVQSDLSSLVTQVAQV